jgi:hypothetical protein
VAPDEGDMHVVAFNVPDVHLSGFPDGKYRVKAELTGNWSESLLHLRLGFRRIEPVAFQVSLTKDHHLVSLDSKSCLSLIDGIRKRKCSEQRTNPFPI